jgi:serine protease AprX
MPKYTVTLTTSENNTLTPVQSSAHAHDMRTVFMLLLTALVVVSSLRPVIVPERPGNIHQALLDLASANPAKIVTVIVQKSASTYSPESLVAGLNASIVRDLSIIHSFVATLQAADVLRLSARKGVRWVSPDADVANSQTTTAVYTTWASSIGASKPTTFADADKIVDSQLGPNDTFGGGSNHLLTVSGFQAEVTPGHAIVKVEAVFRAYSPVKLGSATDPVIIPFVDQVAGSKVVMNHHVFDGFVGANNAGIAYQDITGSRKWLWQDLERLDLHIDQMKFKSSSLIYYDAIGLRITSAPGSDATSLSSSLVKKKPKGGFDPALQANVYNKVIRAPEVWNAFPQSRQGDNVTVAIVDSGMLKNKDIDGRVLASVNFNRAYKNSTDYYGHGTFVGMMVAGDGAHSSSAYMGVAPRADLVNLRISDDIGASSESDIVAALQWVLENKERYNIRVVNLSLNSSLAQSYHTSPLCAAAEVLWFNGIVVVVSAGNNGTGTLFPPANDPFVITVGATDDRGSVTLDDDQVAAFSAYGMTASGQVKPEIVAPGRNIVAFLQDNNRVTMGKTHPANQYSKDYFKMSGTSVSAPMVAGAVALLLEDEPTLNPDQVKHRLMATANKNWPSYNPVTAGAGYLDVYAAVNGNTTETSNTGLAASQLLWSGPTPPLWSSVSWSSVSWSSVSWSSVSWSSVSWSSVSWSSDYWE